MSTVMYAQRIKKSDLPALMVDLREWGRSESIFAKLALYPEIDGFGWSERLDLMKWARDQGGQTARNWEELSVELQVFDRDAYYLLRVNQKPVFWFDWPDGAEVSSLATESWTQHLPNWLDDHPLTTLVRYDNRTDIPPEDRGNEIIADWLDDQIKTGMYLIFNVVSLHDFEWQVLKFIWDKADGKR